MEALFMITMNNQKATNLNKILLWQPNNLFVTRTGRSTACPSCTALTRSWPSSTWRTPTATRPTPAATTARGALVTPPQGSGKTSLLGWHGNYRVFANNGPKVVNFHMHISHFYQMDTSGKPQVVSKSHWDSNFRSNKNKQELQTIISRHPILG